MATTNTNPLTGETITDEALGSLVESCQEKAELMEAIKAAEEKVAALKKKHKYIDEVIIPDKMSDIGLSSITLADGRRVEVTTFYSGSLVKGSEEEAFKFLEDSGFSGIVKCDVTVKLPKGEKEKALEAVKVLNEQGLPAAFKQSIHAMTMKSFVKEQIESGNALPESLFRVYQGNKTKLK